MKKIKYYKSNQVDYDKENENFNEELEESRDIYITSTINQKYQSVLFDIIDWNKEDFGIPIEERIPIRIYIDSEGGELNIAQSLIDIIKLSKTPIYTIGMGMCLSAAGLVLMAAPKGNRMILPSCQLLIHSGEIQLDSMSSHGFKDVSKMILDREKKINEFICENTNISLEEMNKRYRQEWYLIGQDIVDLGAADYIITDIDKII